ncbi:MAG: SPFH domain-containing protein [Thermomicrobiales bacterium]|nr:SPFH domain-containing protein [Thermomicrobiales bacterium]
MAIIDLIQWPNEQPDQIVHRVPERGSGEFVLGSQLVVRESQAAVFVRDGKALDTFDAGRHTLSTNNIPLLTGLIGIPFGGTSPFTAEVYFVAMREFIGLKWGTTQPLTFRDSDLGMVRLRAFGTYSMQVENPQMFVTHIVGTSGGFSTSAIDDFLRSIILNEFNDLLGKSHASLLDIPGMTMDLSNAARLALADDFQRLGLRLVSFQIEAITPPEDVQKRIDERSGMAAIGDMQTYTQFQTAQAMRDAAQNPSGGGAAGIGVGLGAGAAMGQAMAGALSQASQPQAAPAAPVGAPCVNCGKPLPAGANFCPECGSAQSKTCAKCGAVSAGTAKFCAECGQPLS